jgi:hypothetical protein
MKKYLLGLFFAIQSAFAGNVIIWNGSCSSKAFNLGTQSCLVSGGAGSTLPSADIWVGNASNVATAVSMTGDVNIDNTGLTNVITVGGAGAGAIGQTVTDVQNATPNDNPNTIVERDENGFANFTSINVSALVDGGIVYSSSGDLIADPTQLSFAYGSGYIGLGTAAPNYFMEIHSSVADGSQPAGIGFIVSDDSSPERVGGFGFGGGHHLVAGSFSDVGFDFVANNGSNGGFLLTTTSSCGSGGNSGVCNGDIGFQSYEVHSVPTLDIRGVNAGGAVELYGYSDPDNSHAFGKGSLRFYAKPTNDSTPGTHYVGFTPTDSISANVLWVLPNADGTASQVLKTDGSANLGWESVPVQNTSGSVNLTAQGAAISATTLFSTPAAAIYRVCYVATTTRAATTSSVLGGAAGFQIQYTDNDDSVVKKSNPTTATISAVNATGTSISGCLNANAKASTNLQYLMDYTSVGVTTMQYNLHIRVEAL